VRDDQHRFLMLLGQLPARLTAEQAAWVLNCQAHDVPVLVGARLLKPLGNPAHNSVKYFATMEVLELAKDRTWLTKITNALGQHWKAKNRRKKGVAPFVPKDGQARPVGSPVQLHG
jgi:hypothetical protein